jgi:TolB-like protein/class 3 adenylate cyclase
MRSGAGACDPPRRFGEGMESTASRKLAAILAADIVGYSRLMGEDEAGTAKAVRDLRKAAAPIVAMHGGRVFKTMGDGIFIEFTSVVSAVECALAIQRMTAERNAGAPVERRLVYRVGVNLGDVIVEGDDLVGDGVNIASRLEGVAEPGGVCISGSAYEHVRGRIEAEFSDLGEKALKNIARSVRVYAVTGRAVGQDPAVTIGSAGPPRLSIVVLPFASIGDSAEQGYFVDGVTESLTTDLSRMSGAFVIARNTAFAYKGKAADARQIGRELGVRYVLEGSVQRSGERMRVNVQLIEAETGTHLWAQRFDKPVADLFVMQDEIVARIANELKAEIVSVEARRAERTANPDSLDYWLRGFDQINKGVNPESLANARECFSRALEFDPNNVDALVGVVFVDTIFAQTYAFADRVKRIAAAEKLVIRALSRAPRNPMAHYCLGVILILTRRAEQGIDELKLTLSLDANFAFAHAHIGFAEILLGRAEEAEAHIMEALRLSPRDISAYVWYAFLGIAKLLLGQDQEAIDWLRKSVEANRNYPIAQFHCAAALALAGRIDEARLEMQAGLAGAPDFTVQRYEDGLISDDPRYVTQRERILRGLRLAGMPEASGGGGDH